jgi:hypothetical protein
VSATHCLAPACACHRESRRCRAPSCHPHRLPAIIASPLLRARLGPSHLPSWSIASPLRCCQCRDARHPSCNNKLPAALAAAACLVKSSSRTRTGRLHCCHLARFFRNVAATAEHLAHLTVWTPTCRQAPHKPVGCCHTPSALTSSVPHACARRGALRPCPCAGRLTTPSYAPTKEALSLASIEKSIKNWSVFTKIGEIVSDQFHRFSINPTVNLIFFKTLNFLKKNDLQFRYRFTGDTDW